MGVFTNFEKLLRGFVLGLVADLDRLYYSRAKENLFHFFPIRVHCQVIITIRYEDVFVSKQTQ